MCVSVYDCLCVCVSLHSGVFQHPLAESSCMTSFKHTPEYHLPIQPFILVVDSTQECSKREEHRTKCDEAENKEHYFFSQHIYHLNPRFIGTQYCEFMF